MGFHIFLVKLNACVIMKTILKHYFTYGSYFTSLLQAQVLGIPYCDTRIAELQVVQSIYIKICENR